MTKELRFTQDEIMIGTIGGLGTALAGLLMFIKNCAINLVTKRNNDIETRLVILEKSQISLREGQISLISKTREISHQLKNQDKAEASAFQLILDKLEEMKKTETGMALEICKIIDKK